MSTSTDIAWAAGLFEGEGCLSIANNGKGSYGARLWLRMTDKDVVERFASVVGTGVIGLDPRSQYSSRHKDQYVWRIGKKEEVLRIMDLLEPFMGERRRLKFTEVRDFYEFGV